MKACLAKTIEVTVSMETIDPREWIIVAPTAQEMAAAFPTDSRLLDLAWAI